MSPVLAIALGKRSCWYSWCNPHKETILIKKKEGIKSKRNFLSLAKPKLTTLDLCLVFLFETIQAHRYHHHHSSPINRNGHGGDICVGALKMTLFIIGP